MKMWMIGLITLFSCGTCLAQDTLKKAMIFGVTGQDGAYLAEFLLKKGYEVHGVRRRCSFVKHDHIQHLYQASQEQGRRFILHYGDLTDSFNTLQLIQAVEPDEIYNLAGQSHVMTSFEMPDYTCNVNAMGTLRILESIRLLGKTKEVKFYNASSNHIFGGIPEMPQTEHTASYPKSPYGVSKLFSYWITVNYRESFNLFACNGILFNHESPRRNLSFVSKKITSTVAKIAKGDKKILYLGNLDGMRDWGYAKDYVKSMWQALQNDKPDDYVVASGESHSVREFVELAFAEVGIEIEWQGSGLDEKGIDKKTKETLVAVDPIYMRPCELACALGDASKAKQKLGWEPNTSFQDLIKIMVHADLNETKGGSNASHK